MKVFNFFEVNYIVMYVVEYSVGSNVLHFISRCNICYSLSVPTFNIILSQLLVSESVQL